MQMNLHMPRHEHNTKSERISEALNLQTNYDATSLDHSWHHGICRNASPVMLLRTLIGLMGI